MPRIDDNAIISTIRIGSEAITFDLPIEFLLVGQRFDYIVRSYHFWPSDWISVSRAKIWLYCPVLSLIYSAPLWQLSLADA